MGFVAIGLFSCANVEPIERTNPRNKALPARLDLVREGIDPETSDVRRYLKWVDVHEENLMGL